MHFLNAGFVAAFGHCDTAWYLEHLRDDFVCTLADGRRIGRDEFLRRFEQRRQEYADCDEVDVQALGDVALVYGVMHTDRRDTVSLARYTIVWMSREQRWQAVAAQFTPVTEALSAVPAPATRFARWSGARGFLMRKSRIVASRARGAPSSASPTGTR